MAGDIDPILVLGLKLLHSKHPNALEQLRALRDEALGKKPDNVIEKKKDDVKEAVLAETSKKSAPTTEVITISSDSDAPLIIEQVPDTSSKRVLASDEGDDITETVEVESSSLSTKERLADDEVVETVEELGLGFFQETLEELSSSNLLIKRKKPKLEISAGKSMLTDIDVASRESSPDHEMSSDLGVSKCVVCSSGKTGGTGNQLVECVECHELYHQNCHKPRITDQSVNDLRHVWYCRNCSKQMKQASSTTSVPKLKPTTSSPGHPSTKPQIQSFKSPLRVDTKPPIFSPTSPLMNQPFSIPNLTTNISTSGSNSGNGGLKSPSNANPRDVARNSMKRLQWVKKKAAAKNQQRFNKR